MSPTSRWSSESSCCCWRVRRSTSRIFAVAGRERYHDRMRNLVVVAVLLATGCKVDHPGFPPIGGGGGGGGGGGEADAYIADAPDGGAGTLNGRVCVASDARQLDVCDTTGADGFTVKLGTAPATTAANGDFSIASQLGTDLVWVVTGTNMTTSLMPFGAVNQIPMLSASTFNMVAGGSGVIVVAGTGGVIAHTVHGGAPLADVVATDTDENVGYYYDSATSSTQWVVNNATGTGSYGDVWLPNLGVATTTVNLTPMGGSATAIPNVPVAPDALTFITQ